ncbi:unnamed protein product [Cochlearia groenlandica]
MAFCRNDSKKDSTRPIILDEMLKKDTTVPNTLSREKALNLLASIHNLKIIRFRKWFPEKRARQVSIGVQGKMVEQQRTKGKGLT